MSENESGRGVEMASGTPMITLALSPWEVFRALEALEESRGYVALEVAAKLREAAPYHLAALAEAEKSRPTTPKADQ